MPTKKKLPAKTKTTTFGEDLIEGMKLVLAHQRGEIELEQVWPRPIDVKAIRKQVKMSADSALNALQSTIEERSRCPR